MRRILWNIDAMGWFELVDHLIQYGKLFEWSDNISVRSNLKNTIDSFLGMGFEVYAVSSKSELYLKECVKVAGIDLKVQLAANLPEKNMMTDYSGIMDPTGWESLVIGSRPSHQPMKSGIVFLYDYKPFKKNAMINLNIVKKLDITGNGSFIFGYNNLFFGSDKEPRVAGNELFFEDIDFYGPKLEMVLRTRGCHTIPTIFIDENITIK